MKAPLGFSLTVLGSSSATPTLTRNPSAQVLHFRNELFLLDCGEGTQKQAMRFGIKSFRISRIFISHLHPDHYLGLLGLISTQNLNGRKAALHIYAPKGLQSSMEQQFEMSGTRFNFPLHWVDLPEGSRQTLFKNDHIEIECFPLEHRIACWGFLFKERAPYRKIKKELLPDYSLPVEAYKSLFRGEDFTLQDGTELKSSELTMPYPTQQYAYITDTLYLPELAKSLGPLTALYHEATYMQDGLEKAHANHHSTTLEAAEFAKKARAGALFIGHFSARYDRLEPLLEEAKSIFPNTFLAEEGRTFVFKDIVPQHP